MKLISTILPVAALTTAIILPNQQVMEQIVIEKHPSYFDKFKGFVQEAWSGIEDTFTDTVAFGENALDMALNAATDAAAARLECYYSMTAFDTQGWLDSAIETVEDVDIDDMFDQPHKKPHKKPKHPKHLDPYHHATQTVYQLITGSKYTTKFAKLINEYPDLVDLLNGTAAKYGYTVFAPTDAAFEKLPEHDKKPSKELIHKVLTYHISPVRYDAKSVFLARTIGTLSIEDALGGHKQRLRVGFGLGGLKLNFYSKIIAVNIFGTNGVIHGIDTLLLPPPPALKIIPILPSEFSTLEFGLVKTGLDKVLAGPHTGGTLFAPSNAAFAKLGPKVNAFLFSKYGEKHLKALLEYHIVVNNTMYSDAYSFEDKDDAEMDGEPWIDDGGFHVQLPTLLKGRTLRVDTRRWGRLMTVLINGLNRVQVLDGIAKDGVIQVLSNVLIPPVKANGKEWVDKEMSVDEFKEHFDGYGGGL